MAIGVTVLVVAVARLGTAAGNPCAPGAAMFENASGDRCAPILGGDGLDARRMHALGKRRATICAGWRLRRWAVLGYASGQGFTRGHRAFVFGAAICDALIVHRLGVGLTTSLTSRRLTSFRAFEEGVDGLSEACLAIIAICGALVEGP